MAEIAEPLPEPKLGEQDGKLDALGTAGLGGVALPLRPKGGPTVRILRCLLQVAVVLLPLAVGALAWYWAAKRVAPDVGGIQVVWLQSCDRAQSDDGRLLATSLSVVRASHVVGCDESAGNATLAGIVALFWAAVSFYPALLLLHLRSWSSSERLASGVSARARDSDRIQRLAVHSALAAIEMAAAAGLCWMAAQQPSVTIFLAAAGGLLGVATAALFWHRWRLDVDACTELSGRQSRTAVLRRVSVHLWLGLPLVGLTVYGMFYGSGVRLPAALLVAGAGTLLVPLLTTAWYWWRVEEDKARWVREAVADGRFAEFKDARCRANQLRMWGTMSLPLFFAVPSAALFDPAVSRGTADLLATALPDWWLELNSTIGGPVASQPGMETALNGHATALAVLTTWTVTLIIPVLVWGNLVGWWKDLALAQLGPFRKLLSWTFALPGLVFLAVAAAAVAIGVVVVVLVVAAAVFALMVAIGALGDSSSGSGERAEQTAVDRSGKLYKKNSWSGKYEAEMGVFRQKTATNWLGQPKIKQGWTGPREKLDRDGLFGEKAQRSKDGAKLYELEDD